MGVRTDGTRSINTEVSVRMSRLMGGRGSDKVRLEVTDRRSRKTILEVDLDAEQLRDLITNTHGNDYPTAEVTLSPDLGRWMISQAIHVDAATREHGATPPQHAIDEAFLLLCGKFPDVKTEDWFFAHGHANNSGKWVVVFGRYVDRKPTHWDR